MNAIPFVYFSLISLLLYKKRKKFDIAIIIAMIFAVSGFFSILIDIFHLRYREAIGYQFSVGASFAYCALLTMCLLPFAVNTHLSANNLKPLRKGHMLKTFAWIAIIWFIITAIFSWQNMINVLTGDMESYRHMMYQGDAQVSWMLGLPTPIRLVVAVVNSILGCKWSLMFLAFYSRYVQKQKPRYFMMFMIASLSGPMNGIISADRSSTAYWIMSFFAMFFFFRPMMGKKAKRKLLTFAMVVVGALVAYLAAMTIARFGDRDYGSDITGTQGGLISYLGQSYINFCVYFDKFEPPFSHFGIIFPFTYQFILGIPSGGVVIQQLMTELTGFETGVFYTFIGHIIVGAGKTVAIIFCMVYTLISLIVTSRLTRHRAVAADQMYLYFALASVMYLGLFGYYYSSSGTTFGLVAVYIFLRMMK